MPTLETLTEADLRPLMRDKSLSRARGYVQQVRNPVRSGNTLTAQVQGSRLYEVEIDVEPGAIHARCTCPYDWGGFCKHIGAVLLKWIQSPGSFAVRGPERADRPALEVIPVEPPPTRRPDAPPDWMTTSWADRQRADDQQLLKGLEHFTIQDLREIAQRYGWKVRGTQKAAVVQQVAERLTDPEELLKALRSLDEEHRQVLRALVLLGEESGIRPEDVSRVARTWGELRSYKKLETYVIHLREAGLALPGDVLPWGRYLSFIPRALIRRLPPILEAVVPTAADETSGPVADELRVGDPYDLIRAAGQVVGLLEQSPSPLRTPMPRPRLEKFYPTLALWDYDPEEIRRLQDGASFSYSGPVLTVPPPRYALPDETVGRLAPIVGGEERLEFIFSLLVAAGVFQPGSPVTVWPEVKARFLSQSEEAQHAILARTYFGMAGWSELWLLLRRQPSPPLRLRRVAGRSHLKPTYLSADLVRFRQLVLRVLASLPDGRWVALEDLFPLMRALWPRFDRAAWYSIGSYELPDWFLSEAGSERPLSAEDEGHWRMAQGEFIRALIAGPLHWLGLADLQFRNGQLIAFRLHGLADLYWDRADVLTFLHSRALADQGASLQDAVRTEHHTIRVRPSAIPVQAHHLLDQIARLETATADLFIYRLDPHVVYKTFEGGATLSEILENWEQWMRVPMPEDIRGPLTEWWEAYGRVRIYQDLTVIEFGDDHALAEMKAVTSLSERLIAEISPRLVIIPREAVPVLVAELEAAGYTPKQAEGV